MNTDPLPLATRHGQQESARRRLARFRQAHRGRSDAARTAADHSYVLYMTALLTAVLAVPAVHAVVDVVHSPQVLAALDGPDAQRWLGTLAGAVVAALVAVGTVRGPAVRSPFLTVTLAGNDLPRRSTLAGPFGRSALLLTAALVAPAVVVAVALTTATGPGRSTVPFVIATAAYSVLAAGAWLVGQRVEGTRAWALGPALGMLVIAGAAVPGLGRALPWGWFAATWPRPDGGADVPSLVAVATLAVTAAACVPRLLNSMPGATLLGQATRWQGAAMATSAGDLAGAMGKLRAHPTVGRRWRAVGAGPWAVSVIRSDLVGAARAPVRFTTGLLTLALAGWLTAIATTATQSGARWALAATAGVMIFAALGVLSDGIRHAVSAAVAPQLYGRSTTAQVLAHAVVPVGVGTVLVTAGALTHPHTAAVGPTIVTTIALVVTAAVVRIHDSAKGPPPPHLLAPVSTPVGDMSALNMALWQLDAVLWSASLGAVVVSTVGRPLTAAAVVIAAATVLTWSFVRRVRAL